MTTTDYFTVHVTFSTGATQEIDVLAEDEEDACDRAVEELHESHNPADFLQSTFEGADDVAIKVRCGKYKDTNVLPGVEPVCPNSDDAEHDYKVDRTHKSFAYCPCGAATNTFPNPFKRNGKLNAYRGPFQ